ncbi:unnamed protein product [Thelazia callipaeda]|uniref:Uncharacterized protein n=1 Tax=Thelazia callipaeda TaxID=103827 RepID=A0A0N5CTF8_THECL|nr:unnamed protein product [Thelazia callipaeda]
MTTLCSGFNIFCRSIAGISALRLSDKIHQIGCRIIKHCAIPPFLIIIPSFIVQICYAVLLANLTFLYLSKRFASINEQPILILIFGEVIPILLVWLMIFYVFMAELDCFRYIIHCSRNWRLPKYNPAVLNVKDSNFESLLESSSRKHFNVMDALQELERTKSSLSGGTYDSDSKQSFTDAEIKSEAISSKYGTRNASHFSHFSSYARKGYSATGFHLETVPEESPKSSTSLP